METIQPIPVEPTPREIARKISWLNDIFQEHDLTVAQKQYVIRRCKHKGRRR